MSETDLKAVIADLPATLVFRAVTLSVAATEISKSEAAELPGILRTANAQVVGVVSEFTGGVPDVGDKLQLGGVWKRVIAKQESPDAVSVTLTLDDTGH
jgi:hypothetical protein